MTSLKFPIYLFILLQKLTAIEIDYLFYMISWKLFRVTK
jgi:hypothetical protein